MNQLPLVSVICLSHNHLQYIKKAIDSVMKQSYPNVELIIVDDGSSDGTKEWIKSFIENGNAQYIDISMPLGNCFAFNQGFRKSTGDYIIDLAADDILLPERILKGINTFFKSKDAGVTFCDVMNLDEKGNELGTHFKRNHRGILTEKVPVGDIYIDLIKRYFISPPGMMIKREVLEELGGYDESLSYEDFDFWIRSARNWDYAFTDEVLVKKRKVDGSLSEQQFIYKSKHQNTTLNVCQKIKELNRSQEENSALRKRCFYEIKQCIKLGNWGLIPDFIKLI